MSKQLLESAKEYLKNGLCAIAVNKLKRAFLPWKQYQDECITVDKLPEQFNHSDCHSLAILAGKCSGNLEVIDIDLKYDLTGDLYERFKKRIQETDKKNIRKTSYHKNKIKWFSLVLSL